MSDCLCLNCKKDASSLSDSRKIRARNRRTELIKLIEKNPGISFRDLMRLANLKNGVLSHHLKRLENTESIKVEKLPRQTRFYPPYFSEEESLIAKALRKKTPRDILYTLMLNDVDGKKGLEFSQIVSNVSKSSSTVSIYLSQLIRDNIVKTTLDFGRKKKYRVSDKQLVDRLIEDHKPGILEKQVSGFEDIMNSL
ncbi:ArsR family transcriptional regulator [archaeon]|nr:ArsR family transcriptional regulator [archaeon]